MYVYVLGVLIFMYGLFICSITNIPLTFWITNLLRTIGTAPLHLFNASTFAWITYLVLDSRIEDDFKETQEYSGVFHLIYLEIFEELKGFLDDLSFFLCCFYFVGFYRLSMLLSEINYVYDQLKGTGFWIKIRVSFHVGVAAFLVSCFWWWLLGGKVWVVITLQCSVVSSLMFSKWIESCKKLLERCKGEKGKKGKKNE